ncbi:MAG: carboxypeptidase-like regulatory domain-containing protein, partial [Bacteroidaceae bacterium]|nr:carboxypeptidase-like regulatory domain-containing protein [Bacteroidaceae bacterium]
MKRYTSFVKLCRPLLLLMLFIGAMTLQAQNVKEWKETHITLRISNQSLSKVLEMVAEAADAKLQLQGITLVNIDKPISLNVKDKPLDKVIGELVGNQNVKIRYESPRTIILEPYETLPATEGKLLPIEGRVVDAESGEPLIAAQILITDGGATGEGGTITDVEGKFSLRIRSKGSLRISYMGYETLSKQITKPESGMTISLKPSYDNLGEVVITGLS